MIEMLEGMQESVDLKTTSNMILYENDAYEDYPMHWHPIAEVILPVENGYTVRFSGQEVKLRENDICIICPGTVHAIQSPKTGKRIIFQPDTSHLNFLPEVEVLLSFISPYIVVTPEAYPTIHPMMVESINEIREVYLEGAPFYEVEIYSKILRMFTEVGKFYSMKNMVTNENSAPEKEDYASKFLEICDYITEHCDEDLRLDDIAAMSGFSKFYFERLFKQFTGTSFYKYVNLKRIGKAQILLVEPGNTVTDVAMNCGFMSISSFIRMFKIQKGCTPSEFKNLYLKTNEDEIFK